MSNGKCDVKFCRDVKDIAYIWGTRQVDFCESHNAKFCNTKMTEAIAKEMTGGA